VRSAAEALSSTKCATAYDAKQQLTKVSPRLAKATTGLRSAFETHLKETQGQIAGLEQLFQRLDEPVRGKHCDGIAGIIEDGKHGEYFDETTMDACLIASGQRAVSHTAAYGTVVASTLGNGPQPSGQASAAHAG
jgi:ferritin-like metal-binding protein YciE